MKKPIGLILVGGQSTRMGRDKALVEYSDKTLLDHATEKLNGICSNYFLSVNQKQAATWAKDHPHIIDQKPDEGPGSGILSAFMQLNEDLLVLAVDMPLINQEELENLIKTSSKKIRHFKSVEYMHPLPSFWPVEVKQHLKNCIDNNILSLQHIIKTCGNEEIDYRNEETFRNFNAPKDF